ncbi:signal peptidase I [Poriferisphaera corsica]|uniref:Signal peptidase I n=1 Tax=Poriferisphaera corsica TaxID=2528020 RepID=A0A517YVY9_9BACT|nr:signal peptidase I [Poriferisphaera corsica]QDU34384.1 signal peptidase I [Poriferisphaera corsica]
MSLAILSRKNKEKNKPQPKETKQQTALSLVFMFACVLIFHAIVFQPFQIPSGSMAPTLLGNHLRTTCEQCGYTFKLDSHINPKQIRSEPRIICPMCSWPNQVKNAQVSAGDRIIVQKFAYEFTDPKRWDVVVFKTPQYLTNLGGIESRGPINDFIKRCIGLPNENLRILDGNVYVQKLTKSADNTYTPDGDYKIARKNENLTAQRAMFVPIYYSKYIPIDSGKVKERVVNMGGTRQAFYWSPPWVPTEADKEQWDVNKVRSYTYKGSKPSTITFDFKKSGAFNIFSIYPYNQFRRPFSSQHPIEDIRLAVTVEPTNGPTEVTLSTTGRWADGLSQLSANISDKGQISLVKANGETQQIETIASAITTPIKSNTRLELWFVDQQLTLWRDGEIIIKAEYDLPLETLKNRAAAPLTPQVSITVNDAVKLHDVQLDRDIYYTDRPLNRVARGGLHRERGQGNRVIEDSNLQIGDAEFFMVGDNTPWSNDSRFWDDTEPWVSANYMSGDRQRDRGIVPRELLVGKAMVVFYPGTSSIIKPQFGDMRLIN